MVQTEYMNASGVTFRDPELQERYTDAGYVSFNYLTEDQVEELAALIAGAPGGSGGFHWSAISNDLPYRRRISSDVLRICGPSIERTFVGCKGVNATLLIKQAGDPSGEIPPHLDWTFVEEPGLTSCTVWCPLADTSIEGGGMHVLPRSHRLVSSPRGTPYIPSVFDALPREEVLEHGAYVPLAAGEAVAWDHRVLHWSPPNTTSQMRIAVGMAVVPTEANLYHYFMRSDGTVHRYAVDDEAFFGRLILGEEPQARHLGEVQLPEQALDVETLRRVCGGGRQRRGLRRRLAVWLRRRVH